MKLRRIFDKSNKEFNYSKKGSVNNNNKASNFNSGNNNERQFQ